MAEQGGRFRQKRTNFSMVSNELIRNENISLKAKGLYALIQSYITIDGFVLYKGFLLSRCQEGKKAFESAWKELKDSGYLVQYRMQDTETKQFFWEYDLLDVLEKPLPQNGDDGSKPVPQKGCHGSGIVSTMDAMPVGGNNNTEKNDIEKTNIESNHIISAQEVAQQIDADFFEITEKRQVNEIVLLMQEIYNMPDDAIVRIAKQNLKAVIVKDRFRLLNMMHIQYVLRTLHDNINLVRNAKAYLLTTLYNAPATIDSYYQNRVSYDMYNG